MSSEEAPVRPQTSSLWPFVAAAVVAVIVLGAVIAVTVIGGSPAKRNTAERSATSGHAADLVVHNGDSVSGQGEVVAIPGRPVRFCTPLTTPLTVPMHDIETCAIGVNVTGVNLGRLTRRHASDGRVAGLAGLAGTYKNGTMKVTVQSSYSAPSPSAHTIGKPPCAPPSGGWPQRNQVSLTPVQTYATAHPGSIVTTTIVRPTKSEAVAYVLTAHSPTAVRSALLTAVGPALCVARSRYSLAQLDRAQAAMRAQPTTPQVNAVMTVSDGSVSAAGQPEVTVAAPVVSTALAAAVDAQPSGLVRLTAWLSPTS